MNRKFAKPKPIRQRHGESVQIELAQIVHPMDQTSNNKLCTQTR